MYKEYIEGFQLYSNPVNEIHFGTLYTKRIIIDCSPEKERILRVWLPEDYDHKKKYGVIYMSDGQNMVDRFTSPYGEWNMEDHITNLEKEGHRGYIVVGIDCPYKPENRVAEYSAEMIDFLELDPSNGCYGKLFANYLVNVIKPLIDSTFKTDPSDTGFIGSSMGGLISFYLYFAYPEIFKFALALSPAFKLYNEDRLIEAIHFVDKDPSKYGKLVLTVGAGDDFEKTFIMSTNNVYQELLEQGFEENQLLYIFDPNAGHNEHSWSDKVEECLHFVIG